MYQFIWVPWAFCLATKSTLKELKLATKQAAESPSSHESKGMVFPYPTHGAKAAIIVLASVGLAMSRNPIVHPFDFGSDDSTSSDGTQY